MAHKKKEGSLTPLERKIVKGFLRRGWRNQDIQNLVNKERIATINSARITEVKKNKTQKSATEVELDFYLARKNSYDSATGLNFYDDERLIRAREAMLVAVQIFNSPTLKFKTEIFAVLVNIAWTYLLHEYYDRKKVPLIQKDGRSLLLSQMVARKDCPLSEGTIDNINAMKEIRDAVEHTLFRKSDQKWLQHFQANCLNFETNLCELFGEKVSLSRELSFSLQFSKLSFDQLQELQKHDIPETIEALDKNLEDDLGEERTASLEYKFRVVYTFENATKSTANVKFVLPDDVEGEELKNVVIKHETGDKKWPYKASDVYKKVSKECGIKLSSHNHNQAWQKFDVRPRGGVKGPENTNKQYCYYNPTYKRYSYSQEWIEFLCGIVRDEEKFNDLKSFKLT